MKNFEVLKQLPPSDFASMVFHVVRYDCGTVQDFEDFLNKEVQPELEGTLKEALQKIQCSNPS